jgi:serine/threonine protein phosphatase PrpC
MDPVTAAPSWLEWGVAESALERGGSGDRAVVAQFPGGAMLAVIDGLGHGPEAAAAARAAAALLEEHAAAPPLDLVNRCHQGLRKTRGVVMTVACLAGDSLSWVGVGNVEGMLMHRASPAGRISLITRGGVVGYQLPALRVTSVRVSPGDVLALATDGVSSAFAANLPTEGDPCQQAASILARFGKGSDDSLVLIARFVGTTG